VPGGFGLTLFFFLSGYLITTLLVREAQRYGSISLGAFYARRSLRLLPPLFVTLAVAAIAFSLGLIGGEIGAGAIASQLFFYSNYYNLYGPVHQSLDGTSVLWSLAVEEHFYLMFPLVFILLLRRRIGLRHVLGMLLLVLAWRWVRVGWMGADEWTVYFSTDTRIDSILYGCLLALLEWRGLRLPTGPAGWAILAAALATIGASLLADGPLFRSTFRYTLQGIALMPVFYYAVHMPDALPFRPLNWGVVRRLGVYSYAIYLSHDIFITALERRAVEWPVLIAGAATLSIAYAAIVHILVEKPFQRLRARVTGHGRALAPKVGATRGTGQTALGVATQENGHVPLTPSGRYL
jgi:peptidoglycan/LPS O-acetylase OafA/YrhL